jgi:hypothetical protein
MRRREFIALRNCVAGRDMRAANVITIDLAASCNTISDGNCEFGDPPNIDLIYLPSDVTFTSRRLIIASPPRPHYAGIKAGFCDQRNGQGSLCNPKILGR